MTTSYDALDTLIERMRRLEIDHAPDGYPPVKMRYISAICERLAELDSDLELAEREVDDAREDVYQAMIAIKEAEAAIRTALAAKDINAAHAVALRNLLSEAEL